MQHIITDEEVERFYRVFSEHAGSIPESRKFALSDFLNNRPQVAQLRPIAEMPEKPSEGCVRIYSHRNPHGQWSRGPELTPFDTHATDIFIQLPTPDPDAEERRQFEEETEAAGVCSDFRRDERGLYRIAETCVAWDAWKLRGIFAKKGGDK